MSSVAIVSPDEAAQQMQELIKKQLISKGVIVHLFSSSNAMKASGCHFDVYVLDEFAGGADDEGKTWQPHLEEIRQWDPSAAVILYSAFLSDALRAKVEKIEFFGMSGSLLELGELIATYLPER